MKKSFFIKNMSCTCCVKLLNLILKNKGFKVINIKLGYIEIEFTKQLSKELFIETINSEGFSILESKDLITIEKIKHAVFELVYNMNNVNSIIRKSDYLIEKIGLSYQHMSKLFSKYEKTTLEKYIINQKINKAKELIKTDEYTLSEIAYMMDYSSVQHLSNQFKKITGQSVSEFKDSVL